MLPLESTRRWKTDMRTAQKMCPPPLPRTARVGRETNELPAYHFKTDLVENVAPGNTARSFEINTFRECLNIRDRRF